MRWCRRSNTLDLKRVRSTPQRAPEWATPKSDSHKEGEAAKARWGRRPETRGIPKAACCSGNEYSRAWNLRRGRWCHQFCFVTVLGVRSFSGVREVDVRTKASWKVPCAIIHNIARMNQLFIRFGGGGGWRERTDDRLCGQMTGDTPLSGRYQETSHLPVSIWNPY